MSHQTAPQVVAADRLNEGVVITFSDNRSGFYSSDLLYRVFEEAQEIKGDLFEADDSEPSV